MKNSLWKRVLALVLCLALSAGYLPMPSLAEDTGETVELREEHREEAQEEPEEETTEAPTEATEATEAPTEKPTEATEAPTEATEAPTEETTEPTTAPTEEQMEEVSEEAALNEGEAVASIGETPYATLQEAFTEAQDGDTITLLKGIEGEEIEADGKTLTLETNGQAMKDVTFREVNLTIHGNEEGSQGKVALTADYNANVTVASGHVESVYVYDCGMLTNEGGTVEHVTLAAGMSALNGGPFPSVRIEIYNMGDELLDRVPGPGYYFFYENGKMVREQDLPLGGTDVDEYGDKYYYYTIPGTVKVEKHTHTFDETTGECVCGETAAARIGETTYATLQAAFDAVNDGDEITLLKAEAETVSTAADGTVTLDLNGKTLDSLAVTGGMSLKVTGGDTVTNLTLSGSGTLTLDNATVENVTIDGTPKLSGGPFNQVFIYNVTDPANINLAGLVPEGCALRFTESQKPVTVSDFKYDTDKGGCVLEGPVEVHTHVYDRTTGQCECGALAGVARIGEKFYPTMQAALNAAKDKDTITLLADATLVNQWGGKHLGPDPGPEREDPGSI